MFKMDYANKFNCKKMPPSIKIITSGVLESMENIQEYCNSYPDCEGCQFNKKHKGCIFRGKSPREWKVS